MKAAGGGSIVNFGSVSWKLKQGGMPVYTTSKAAVQGLTRSLARDFGPFNIRVNTLVPGWVMTEKQIRLWLDEKGTRGDRARPVHQPAAAARAHRAAWRCSSPPTTARCAPRRTSSSTAAGSDAMSGGAARALRPSAGRPRGARAHARQRPRPGAARDQPRRHRHRAATAPTATAAARTSCSASTTSPTTSSATRTSARWSAATRNRIAGGRFVLDGEAHQLALQRRRATRCTAARPASASAGGRSSRCRAQTDGSVALELTLTSDDGDEHYPGRLDVTVRYTLTPANEWRIDYRATTSRADRRQPHAPRLLQPRRRAAARSTRS